MQQHESLNSQSDYLSEALIEAYQIPPGLHGDFMLADSIHHDERRLTGRPFIFHPLEIMQTLQQWGFEDDSHLRLALLHDTVERLRKLGDEAGQDAIRIQMEQEGAEEDYRSLLLLSHDKNRHDYWEYVTEIAPDPTSRVVKIFDLFHNIVQEPMPDHVLAASESKRNKRALQIDAFRYLIDHHHAEQPDGELEEWAVHMINALEDRLLAEAMNEEESTTRIWAQAMLLSHIEMFDQTSPPNDLADVGMRAA